jgi:hypothetical protein
LLLRDDYRNWCIRVVGSDTLDFASDHEVAVFSDQILLDKATQAAMQIPRKKNRPQNENAR